MVNKSVVLDRTFSKVLFALAMEEGLLFEIPERSDYVFRRFQTYKPADALKTALLEQVVLTPELIVVQDIPTGWLSGRLVEEGVLKVSSPPDESIVRIGEFSQEILEAMLQARGYKDIRGEELHKRLEVGRKALEEQARYEAMTGKKAPSLTQKKIQDILSQARFTFNEEYSPEEYRAQELRQQAYNAVTPIIDCMEEYEKIVTIASRESAQIRIPVKPFGEPPSKDYSLATIRRTESNLALLRLVANQLGRLPRRLTLADSLELSRSPYTTALREQLSLWQGKLESGEFESLNDVQREVREAGAALQEVRTTKNVGRIATYLSVPISLLDVYLGSLTALGIGVGVLGLMSQLTADVAEQQLRWVMFGTE
jgi:hypothetical protein